MTEVYPNIYVGNGTNCSWSNTSDWAVIHACKHPCHRKAVGYTGNLNANHPNYLIYEKNNHLVLNMVDMEQELSALYTNPIMKAAISFIEKNIKVKKILVHCNQGQSRSPSIALLYLARVGHINSQSYVHAAQRFKLIYPLYSPGNGIAIYLKKNWKTLLQL